MLIQKVPSPGMRGSQHSTRFMRLATCVVLSSIGCAEQKFTAFNANPEVEITSHEAGDSAPEGMPVVFFAGAMDPDHDTHELTAAWVVSGEEVCEATALDADGQSTCEITLSAEDATVSVRVRDPLGGIGGDTVRLNLEPTLAPTVTIVRPERDELLYADYPVRFVVEVEDAEDAATDLTVQWESSLDGEVGSAHTPTSDGRVVDSVELSEGVHGLTVLVTDSTGKTGSDATDIVVGPPNGAPSCEIVSPASDTVMDADRPLSLLGMATDPNVAPDFLTATWTSDKVAEPLGTGIPSADSGEVALTISSLEVDDHLITLRVEDERGASCTDEVLVTVTSPPQAEITAPQEDGRYYSDHALAFSGQVSDEEDGPSALTAQWTSDRVGVLPVDATPTAEGLIDGAGTLNEGEHILTLTVTDADGSQGTDTVVIFVGPPNSDPACAITSPPSGSGGDSAASITLSGVVADADEGPELLSVQWQSSMDGALGVSTPDSAGNVSNTVSGLTEGTHVISLVVTDEVGAVCTSQINYVVGISPTAEITSPADGAIWDEGQTIRFSATVSDLDEDPLLLLVEWSSSLDGVLSTAGADSLGSVSFERGDLQRGTHTITLRVTDTMGLYANASIALQINGIPSAPVVRIEPEPAMTSDMLIAEVVVPSEDPEGGTVTYSYAWTKDGVGAVSTSSVSAALTAKHETWIVRVTPTDGVTEGPSGEATVTIVNSPPEVTRVEINPSSLATNDMAVADVEITDADGDDFTTTYTWTVDGVESGTGGDSLDGASWFDKGQVVGLAVQSTDTTDAGASTEAAPVVVVNTPPTAPEVSIDPEAPGGGAHDLWCKVDTPSTDTDDDDVSYTMTWEVDDLPYPDDADSGAVDALLTTLWTDDTVPGHATIREEEWVCTATPSDGEADGAVATAEVTIGSGCGDDVLDPGEEVDPPPGPYTSAPVDAETCRYDFSGIQQLYCGGACDYGGAPGCDQADADVLCKLITDNPDSEASSYYVESALSEPGFSAVRCGLGDTIEVDRGLDTTVGFQDFSLLATHGDGDVIAWPVCTAP